MYGACVIIHLVTQKSIWSLKMGVTVFCPLDSTKLARNLFVQSLQPSNIERLMMRHSLIHYKNDSTLALSSE